MYKPKFLMFAALGAALVLLARTEKGKSVCKDLADSAGEWKGKLKKAYNKTGTTLNHLKGVLADEIEGLGDDARERIQAILDETTSSAKKIKNAGKGLA